MRIWEMRSGNGSVLTPSKPWSVEFENMLDGRSMMSSWVPDSFEKSKTSQRMPLTDISGVIPGTLFALSERAVKGLRDLIENDVELLPICIGDSIRWLMYTTAILDCVDYEHSTYSLLSNGKIFTFESIVFEQEKIEGHNVFKLADKPTSFVLVSDVFKERVEALDLQGAKFVLVWDSEGRETIRLPFSHQI